MISTDAGGPRHEAIASPQAAFTAPLRTTAVPHYFPVEEGAFRMRAGLQRFPADFGNGEADARTFVADTEWTAYVAAKHTPGQSGSLPIARTAVSQAPEDVPVVAAAWSWLCARMLAEVAPVDPSLVATDPADTKAWRKLVGALQEDVVVVRRLPEGGDRVVVQSVSFPAGWRPERILGAPFSAIHTPVPEFASDARASASMISAMVERGPYVRFVWTISPDAYLDHHPDEGQRGSWASATAGEVRLRMERQLTIPLRAVDAAVFVIRTLQRPLVDLDAPQRARIAAAISSMTAAVRAYKGFAGHEGRIAELLGAPIMAA